MSSNNGLNFTPIIRALTYGSLFNDNVPIQLKLICKLTGLAKTRAEIRRYRKHKNKFSYDVFVAEYNARLIKEKNTKIVIKALKK